MAAWKTCLMKKGAVLALRSFLRGIGEGVTGPCGMLAIASGRTTERSAWGVLGAGRFGGSLPYAISNG
eukprot:6815127-Pyramimonas_sp.AAC.1